VVAVENDSLKVQRADGSETFSHWVRLRLFDVGEKRKLKVAAWRQAAAAIELAEEIYQR
jgi:hypothetical protein